MLVATAGVRGRLPHECVVGLSLNLGRAETRRAAGTLMAITDALSGAGLSQEWFKALATTPLEAEAAFAGHRAMQQAAMHER